MLTPFYSNFPLISRMFGNGTSARLWPGNLVDSSFDEKKELIKWLKPELLLAFVDRSDHHNEKIKYLSDEKNNLEPYQKTDKIVEDLKWILSRLSSVNYLPKGKYLYWEAWNEPQHIQNGAWNANEFANYINVLASKIKKEKLPVKVGAPLHMDDSNWNVQLCKKLDTNLVDFLVNHYYGFWQYTKQPNSDFLARAGFGITLRDRVRKDMELIKKYGNNVWTLHCSEWNLHPNHYSPPFESTTDMAAAIYAISAIRIFLEEGLESAQFFLISSQEHFGTLTISEDGKVKVHATGKVFKLINEFLRGKLLKIDVYSPKYSLDIKKVDNLGKFFDRKIYVPYIEAIGCLSSDGIIKIILCNRNEVSKVSLKIDGIPASSKIQMKTLTSKSDDTEFSFNNFHNPDSNLPKNYISLPEKSITAVTVFV